MFEIKENEPRLTGGAASAPFAAWRIVEATDSLTVVPDNRVMLGLVRWLFFLAGVCPIGFFFLFWHSSQIPSSDSWSAVAVFSCSPSVALLIGAVLLEVRRRREIRAGPWLQIGLATGRFTLPRNGLVFTRQQSVRWDIVYGCWLRTAEGNAKRLGEDISELQLVVRDGARLLAVPVIAGPGAHSLDSAASTIAASSDLPLLRLAAVKQDHQRMS